MTLKLVSKLLSLVRALSFVHLNKHTVGICGEDFRFFGGNGGVMLDESGHGTSGSLDAEGKRGNIEEGPESSQTCYLKGWQLGRQHPRQQLHQG